MKYGYYPGCSLERNASAYHESALAVAEALGIEFAEVPDWNCCGATEYIAIDLIPAYALISRNLALAQQQNLNGNGAAQPTGCPVQRLLPQPEQGRQISEATTRPWPTRPMQPWQRAA